MLNNSYEGIFEWAPRIMLKKTEFPTERLALRSTRTRAGDESKDGGIGSVLGSMRGRQVGRSCPSR